MDIQYPIVLIQVYRLLATRGEVTITIDGDSFSSWVEVGLKTW